MRCSPLTNPSQPPLWRPPTPSSLGTTATGSPARPPRRHSWSSSWTSNANPAAPPNPWWQELKKEYGDRITFVHRYFPLPGHRNSGTAALAVEAAAQQGKYEQMASKLFETQPQWGEKQESQAALFRTYAQELGLDTGKYDAAVADEDTKDTDPQRCRRRKSPGRHRHAHLLPRW